MLYLTSPWLLCTYQFVLLNSFTFFTQPGNPSFVLYSCEVIWYLFFSVWLISLSIIPSRLLIKLPVYFISLNLSHLTYDLITLNHSIFLKHTECQIPFCLCSCSLHSLEMFLSYFHLWNTLLSFKVKFKSHQYCKNRPASPPRINLCLLWASIASYYYLSSQIFLHSFISATSWGKVPWCTLIYST